MEILKESAVIGWYRQYVKNNEEHVRLQVITAQNILSENYRGVYDFFCDILESPVNYKILRARRCQVLFFVFLPIILLEEGDNIKITGEFISDHALSKYGQKVINSSGILVDDIVIHGRGLRKIYNLIDENFMCPNLSVYVYAKCRKAILYDKLETKIISYVDVFEQEWKSLSTQFVNLIYAFAAPYASYVESIYENTPNFSLNEVEKNFWIIDNTNHYQEIQKEKSLVLFEKEAVPRIFDKLGYDCCLRVYTSEIVERTMYIPYIFIRNFVYDLVYRIIEKVCSKLPEEKTKNIIHDLSEKCDVKGCDAVEYKIKLFNTLMNHIYGLHIKEEYKIMLEKSNLNFGMLAVCYGEEIAEEFSRLEYKDVSAILTLDFPDCIETEIKEDSELEDKLINVNFSQSEVSEDDKRNYVKEKLKKLQEYFYQNGLIDEKLARLGESRKKGLSLGAFYKRVKLEDTHWMSISQLNAWDSGIASCDIIFDGNNFVSSYVASGEQSFRYVLEQHKKLLKDMIYAYNSPLWTKTDKTGGELASEVYNKYLKEHFPEQMEDNEDKKILMTFIEENRDKLKDWGIPEIFA